jgi:ligand-binding sensor domain-containing protein
MNLTSADGLPSDSVYALLTDAQGVVWIGTDKGLAKYEQGQLRVVFGEDDKRIPNRYIRDLALAPDGALLIGTFTGLARFDGTEPVTLIDLLKSDYRDSRLITLAASPSGRVWIGTDKGLLYSDDLNTWSRMTIQDGLLTNGIAALLVDPFGAVWVGGGSNISGGGLLHIVP